jgi:methyl-accepting chemotaxis protein
MSFLKNMKITTKALLIVAMALIPIGYLMFSLIKEKSVNIDFAKSEIAGAQILDNHLRDLLISGVEGRFSDLHKDGSPYAKLDGEIIEFSKEMANSPYLSAESLKTFNETKNIEFRLDRIIDMTTEIADKSNLTLDPDVDSYYTMDIVTNRAANLIMEMSDIHKLMSDVVWGGTLSNDHRTTLIGKAALVDNHINNLMGDAAKSFAGNPDGVLKAQLEKLYADSESTTRNMLKLVETMLASSDPKAVSLESLDAAYMAFVKANDKTIDIAAESLISLLQKRINKLEGDEYVAIGVTIALVLLTVGFLVIITRSISKPIAELVATMDKLTNRETNFVTPGVDRKDEVGALSRAAESLRKRVAGAFQFATNIETSVSAAVSEVAGASKQIQASANGLNKLADETKQLSTAVAAASTEAAQTSSQVAASAEELTASISEISSKVQQSSRVANDASNKGQAINIAMKGLAEKSGRVNEVINVITKIAEQINLLALNATIEAARAGEAGKGFAVVASEVKSLSTQTAKAADEITQQIGEMQGATTLAVDSVSEIMGIIQEITTNITAVAAAVEEQSAATNEIARNIAQTATGTQEISQNIVSVENGAEETGKTSKEMLTAIDSLNGQTASLRERVEAFLKEMRAA